MKFSKLLALASALVLFSGLAQAAAPFVVHDMTVNGTATVPTPATGTNSTQVANMAAIVQHNTPCQSILDYGGKNDGVTANDTAMAAAVAAQPTGNVCVYFPQGKYKFNSNYTYTSPTATAAIAIYGAGPGLTELTWPNPTGGLGFSQIGPFNHFHVRDLTLSTGTTNGGDAINAVCTGCIIGNPANTALSDITNVVTRGADGYEVTDYWSIGVNVLSVSDINFTSYFAAGSASLQGQGIHLTGTTNAIAVAYNIQSSIFNALNVGIYYDTWTQGVTVNQSNFTGDAQGILAAPSEIALDQLSVVGSQFNTTVAGILLQSPCNATMIAQNFFLVQNNSTGIFLQQVAQFSIVGNTFNPAVGSPINITAITIGPYTAAAGVITGNQIFDFTLGIWAQSTSRGVNVQSNSYLTNTTNTLNSASAVCPATASGNCFGGGSQ